MAQFITPISETREKLSRFKGDYRFGNFEVIPSLPTSGPAHKSEKHVRTYFNNKQIFRTISEWFEVWMPWQRRIVLCGTTDRCSTSQLEYLATALEPVFHRDFQNSLRGSYPSLTSRKVIHTNEQSERTVKLSDSDMGSVYTKQEDQSLSSEGLHSLNSFALKFVNNIISEAVQMAAGRNVEFDLGEESYDESQKSKGKKGPKRKPSPIKEVQESSSFELESKVSHTLSPTRSQSQQSTYSSSSRDSMLKVPMSDKTSFSGTKHSTTSSQKDGLLLIERKSVDTSSFLNQFNSSTRPLESSFSAKPSERRKAKNRSQAYNHYFCGQEDTVLADEHHLDDLPPLEAKKVSTFNWCMSHRVTPSAGSTAVGSAESRRSKPHKHTKSYPLPGSAATTADYFDRSKIQKLGAMKGVLRTGQINKPPQVQDLYIPVQKTFKPSKWWTPRPVVVPAKKQQLRAAFKDQLEQIWSWMKEWEDHEKGDLLVELIKMCDQELIKFFASCLTKRLEDRMDINSLPDKVLLRVFYMLSPTDLLQVELVCKRWRFLVSHEELWRYNCRLLGTRYNSADLVQLIEFYMSEDAVDWREAFWQLTDIMVHHDEAVQKPDSKRLWKMVTDRISELRRRYLHEETESESSVSTEISESDSVCSEVVEIAIAVARPRPTSARTESSSDNGMDEPDRGSSGSHTPVDEMLHMRRRGALRPQRKSMKMEDIALDIRPELHRAEDLLNPSSEHEEHMHYDGKIKQVKRVRRLQGHSDTICCVRFDIRRLITGSMDRTIRVWDIRSGKGIRRLTGHKGGIRCLQLDETRIVSGSWDMSVMVWDVVRFELLAELTGHTGVVSCLQFNDRLLVTGSHDRTLRVWSMFSYECKHTIKHHTDVVTCLVLEDEAVISGSFDRSLKVTDVDSGECLQNMTHEKQDRITTIQCLDDQILVGTLTGRLLIWNRTKGTLARAYQALESPMYKLVVFSVDYRETKIFIASADGSIGEWVLDSMTCVRILQGHRGPVRDVQVSHGRVVSCSEDKTARIWDLSPPPLKPGDESGINPQLVNERDSD
ncbi:uncharacterized protein LOC756678 isoform X2 [Strongylocentrotus purpuratus]|uniref:F-box domain-containing protein n=1 Tax=Strongylocentrotus purpuratus TaxID=7668 RepID=A0A7M7LW85_STRPU|nr:uncharacterized protein LOC756678 isoform X2 [Strongylocentrotus purpuratus]